MSIVQGTSTDVVIGDGDVLTGVSISPDMVRIWFAPLPENHGLTLDEPIAVDVCKPLDTTVANVMFVKEKSFSAFVDMLIDVRSRAFNKKEQQ